MSTVDLLPLWEGASLSVKRSQAVFGGSISSKIFHQF